MVQLRSPELAAFTESRSGLDGLGRARCRYRQRLSSTRLFGTVSIHSSDKGEVSNAAAWPNNGWISVSLEDSPKPSAMSGRLPRKLSSGLDVVTMSRRWSVA